MRRAALGFLILSLLVGPALGQEPPAPEPAPAPEPEPEPDPTPDGRDDREERIDDLERRLDDLADENEKLVERVEVLEEDLAYSEQRLDKLAPIASKLTGYLDFGFFMTTGNGAGTRTDVTNLYFPEYAGVVPDTWVFMGDPLSTAVNARGEPADTGESRAIVFDPLNSGGKPTFVVNSLSLALFAGLGPRTTVNGAFDLVPRARDASDPSGGFMGDYLDVKLAYLEHRVVRPSWELTFTAGKADSVLGFEYRSQDAPDRLAVTPSLICRYTCGRPLGLKARLRLPGDRLVANLAVTNGSHFSELFPFSNELDVNAMKTGAARVSYRHTFATGFAELGASGALGAQDFQPEDDVWQWHVGGDLRVEWRDLELTGEYVKGEAAGQSEAGQVRCGLAPCIDYQGAYGLLGYRLTNVFEPYVRVDWRDALHQDGASFVYESEVLRVTTGLRAELGEKVVLKGEYTLNRELGRTPQFPDDVLTTALVVKF